MRLIAHRRSRGWHPVGHFGSNRCTPPGQLPGRRLLEHRMKVTLRTTTSACHPERGEGSRGAKRPSRSAPSRPRVSPSRDPSSLAPQDDRGEVSSSPPPARRLPGEILHAFMSKGILQEAGRAEDIAVEDLRGEPDGAVRPGSVGPKKAATGTPTAAARASARIVRHDDPGAGEERGELQRSRSARAPAAACVTGRDGHARASRPADDNGRGQSASGPAGRPTSVATGELSTRTPRRVPGAPAARPCDTRGFQNGRGAVQPPGRQGSAAGSKSGSMPAHRRSAS